MVLILLAPFITSLYIEFKIMLLTSISQYKKLVLSLLQLINLIFILFSSFPLLSVEKSFLKRMHSEWITNYEKLLITLYAPVTDFTQLPDGSVKATYQLQDATVPSSSDVLPFAYSMAIFPIESETYITVLYFYHDGKNSYVDNINGHFIWNVAPKICDSYCNCDDYSADDDYVP